MEWPSTKCVPGAGVLGCNLQLLCNSIIAVGAWNEHLQSVDEVAIQLAMHASLVPVLFVSDFSFVFFHFSCSFLKYCHLCTNSVAHYVTLYLSDNLES